MELLAASFDAAVFATGLVVLLLIFMPFSPMLIDVLLLPRKAQLAIYKHRHALWTVVWAAAIVLVIRGLNAIAEPSGVFAPLITLAKAPLGGWAESIFGAGDPVWLTTTLITVVVASVMFWSGYVPFVMTPPADPTIFDAKDADALIRDDDVVLGIVNGADARAYPRDYIARPHFFEDSVGGTPLIVSYCILCNSSIAFKPELEGRRLHLRCVTAFNNNIIYHDPASDNYIQQLDGTVIDGPDAGKALEMHPVLQTTWREWKRLYPQTKLYYAPEKTLRDRMVGIMLQMLIPIHKLARRKAPWHRIRGKLDSRLPAMAYVYAIERNGERKAYAQADMASSPVTNDTVGGDPIVLLYDSASEIGDIFLRIVSGRTLAFEPASSEEGAVARDRETGSSWSITGEAIAGEMKGAKLTRLPHYNKIFWFSWPLFKPDTGLGGPRSAA